MEDRMLYKLRLIIIVIFLMLGTFSLSYGEKPVSLTLEECITTALKNNLRISIERYNPELADASVMLAKEIFMPRFDLSYGRQSMESPSYWWLQGDETQVTKYSDYSLSLLLQIPLGGNLSLSLTNYRSDTNASFQLINPRYGSTLRLDFTQPLLKNFGLNISRKDIIIAQNNLEISQEQFRTVLHDTIFRVQEAYWNLVYAIENHRVKEQSLQLGRDLLAKNLKEVEVGKLAPIEILNAETVVAQREADILQAEALIRKGEDLLSNILNKNAEIGSSGLKIVPGDEPVFAPRDVSLERVLEIALNNRPDLKATVKNIKTKELNLTYARNQMLPGLDLNFSYWSPGLSGDRVLYLDNNPFSGIIVGREPGSAGDSVRDAFKLLYNNWTVGVTLSFPLSNVLSKADFVRARIELDKSRIELEDTRRQALLEVRDAVRDIETHSKRVEAYRLARTLAEKRMQAEEKKLRVGLTTNYFVLQYQEELANARSLEIKAIVDYNLAWAKLEQATGMSLKSRNILVK